MNSNEILKPEIQKFIYEQTGANISKLAFQKNPFPNIDFKTILNQIEGREKSREKLPSWYKTSNIIYPSKISIEQTSSEITAKYKSEITTGKNLIDVSGGFGVDDFYFSQKTNNVVHCEINDELSQIVDHNFKQLGALNISCKTGDSAFILKDLNLKFDWIYIDPSRRNEVKGKVFMLKDCLPNVPILQDFYYTFSNNILIKTAPILDITAGLSELRNVKNIHIVAVSNEVKEILWEIEKDFEDSPTIKTINLTKDGNQSFEFKMNSNSDTAYSLPQKYLYEPNSAIMKSGGFYEVSRKFSLCKLQQHSHLYTSDQLIDFPGRIFTIEKKIEYTKKEMVSFFSGKQYNITTRNFPETVENIRKKWKIKEGGNQYCFFTTDINEKKIVLICNKIKFS